MAPRFDLRRFLADEQGATAIEYGVLIACLGLALVAVFKDVQNVLFTTVNDAADKVDAAVQ